MNLLFRRFQGKTSTTAHQNIKIDEYRSRFADQADHFLVDVRTPGEYASGHLPGSVNIPLNQLAERTSEIPTDRPVIMVCATANRSATAARMLVRAGYQDVFNLQGGTMRWMIMGLPLER